jgi:hypothetical protein
MRRRGSLATTSAKRRMMNLGRRETTIRRNLGNERRDLIGSAPSEKEFPGAFLAPRSLWLEHEVEEVGPGGAQRMTEPLCQGLQPLGGVLYETVQRTPATPAVIRISSPRALSSL